MGFTKRMPPCDQRYGFLVIHGHAAKRVANIKG